MLDLQDNSLEKLFKANLPDGQSLNWYLDPETDEYSVVWRADLKDLKINDSPVTLQSDLTHVKCGGVTVTIDRVHNLISFKGIKNITANGQRIKNTDEETKYLC